jgi:hypothetical protein
MKIGNNTKSFLIASGIVVLIILIFFVAGDNPMVPEADWHLQFHVADKSGHALQAVRIEVHALGKVTAYNQVFHVEPKRWNFEGITDAHGNYRLNSRACVFGVKLSKNGYRGRLTSLYKRTQGYTRQFGFFESFFGGRVRGRISLDARR